MLPRISCVCITYLRDDLLEEAIESFLRQDYKGPKELIIINDYDGQTLKFNHPDVYILNTKRRFNTIGEKRNTSIALSNYDWIAPWDDDDIYLPHRLTHSIIKIKEKNLDYYKLNSVYNYDMNVGIKFMTTNQFYGASMYSKETFKKTSGHGFNNVGEDTYFETQIKNDNTINKLIENKKTGNIDLNDIYYIYRWVGISGHLSAYSGKENQLELVKEKREKTNTKRGVIELKPKWNQDYLKLTKEFLKNIQ